MTKVIVAVAMVLFVMALAFGISAGLGWISAWVLGYFGVKVPWYVCSVAIFVIGMVFKSGASGK